MAVLKLYPYKMGSESAKDLANILNVTRVRPDGEYIPKIGHTIVNWGSSRIPNWYDRARLRSVSILNKPEAVQIASNKLKTLTKLSDAGINVPQFTTDIRVARYWLERGDTVVERHTLTGNSAEGVRIVNLDDDEMPSDLRSAPLYTKFIPKVREFRVHVFRGRVIDYCEKKKMSTERRGENFNKYICSNEMGWVFCRNDIKHIDSVKELAIRAVTTLGLDFAAVDVVYYNETPYILEANTAPGIVGTTLYKYANAFRSYLGLPDIQEVSNTENVNNVSRPSVQNTANNATPAAVSASVGSNNRVTLELDLDTARKLHSLLNGLLAGR